MKSFLNAVRQKKLPFSIKSICVVIVLAGGFLAYRQFKTSPTSKLTYQTAQVEKGTLIVSLSGSGQVSSANTASVTTKASGVVKKISAQNGKDIKSGAPLLEIELDRTAKQQYEQALSSYQAAKNSLDAAKSKLYTLQSQMFAANQKFINDAVARNLASSDPTYIQQSADWLASEADYKNQQNVIAQAQTAVSSSWLSLQQSSPVVYAPISGKVTGLSLQLGSVIASGSDSSSSTTASSQKIASIVTEASPTISINETQIDVTKIAVGNKATITLDAFPDKTFTGKVVSIDTVGTVSSGVTSYPTVIMLDSATPDIFANMSAQANIITLIKNDVLLVPTSVVQTQNGSSTVRVMNNGVLSSVPVEVGAASDTQIEVVSGLKEGDTVVTGTTSSASSGSQSRTGQTTSPFSVIGGGARTGQGNRNFGGGAGVAVPR